MNARHAHAALLPTLASLLGLLVVPALHGSLSHGHGACAEPDTHREACLEGGGTHDQGVESTEHCPLCLAAGRSRAVLPGLVVFAAPAPAVGVGKVAPREPPARAFLRPLAPAAPRAPPHLV